MTPPINRTTKLPLLGLINAATGEIGLPQYTSIVGNPDTQAMQLLALAKREGKEFYQMGNRIDGWQELRSEYTFSLLAQMAAYTGNVTAGNFLITNIPTGFFNNVVFPLPMVTGNGIPLGTHVGGLYASTNTIALENANATITGMGVSLTFAYDRYALPSDFGYFMVQTGWDRSFRWQLLGPLDAQEWQVLKSGISPTGPRRRYRFMNNYLYFDPTPTAAEDVVLEYYSNAWVQSLDGSGKATWAADTDYYVLDDDCFIQGLKWRILAAKKLDYGQEKEDYDRTCERVASRNGGQRDLPINATSSGLRLLNNNNVPDTGYGA